MTSYPVVQINILLAHLNYFLSIQFFKHCYKFMKLGYTIEDMFKLQMQLEIFQMNLKLVQMKIKIVKNQLFKRVYFMLI